MPTRLLYTFFIHIYTLLIRFAALFSTKARLWVQGRYKVLENIDKRLKDEAAPLIWIHASSLGEFEQGRPVIENIKKQHPVYKVLLTFFSPSGYEIRKNYSQADYVFYLPPDTMSNAKKFITLVKPKIAVFIKYEYWFNYLDVLSRKGIPVFFISAIFRKEHYFFKLTGRWSLNQLKKVDYFFVQDSFSKDILNKHGINKVDVTGDTRFDRVLEISKSRKELPIIDNFKANSRIFIAGSTWEKDTDIICQLTHILPDDIKFIIAPHLMEKSYLQKLKVIFGRSTSFYSEMSIENAGTFRTVIIDNIGMLSSLYSYGYIAYIGGGFGKGIHNILEASCYGLPVIFGPQYNKFREARELIALKAAFSIKTANELINVTQKLFNEKVFYKDISEINKNYVITQSGATDKIIKNFKKYI